MKQAHEICKLASQCKMVGVRPFCSFTCSPFLLLHGVSGTSGLWRASNVPMKYCGSLGDTLPIEGDNPLAYAFVMAYIANVLENVQKGTGLFFYSIPNAENKFGTGTGKTTAATAIINEYLLARVKEDSRGTRKITHNPVLFYKASELQNLYNAQFRGTAEMQDEASRKYYKIKKMLMSVELVCLDDIGIRTKITDAFENEITEIIDGRDSKMLATIYTSNLPIDKLAETMGERIASRIAGMTKQVAFKGKDHRKVNL